MGKYKVCVYAICKNEEKFAKKWYESMSEADYVCVLDTGSNDNTVDILRKLGARVESKVISPWRFDVARNLSMELIPDDTDICVCTDLDEVFNVGWREILEEKWETNACRVLYNYNWSLDEDSRPIINFYLNNIHKRDDYVWIHPVHEVLTYMGDDEVVITVPEICLNHYPDKEKSRGSYLPLLEMSVEEDPLDDRNMHYLGREYMYYGKWNDAIDVLTLHLGLESAKWKDERCASMRFIGRCYGALKRHDEARLWYDRAIIEAPYLRDGYVEYGIFEYDSGNYEKAIWLFMRGLFRKRDYKSYINEAFCRDGVICDYISMCLWYLGDYDGALYFVDRALRDNPNDERLLDNRKIFSNMIEE